MTVERCFLIAVLSLAFMLFGCATEAPCVALAVERTELTVAHVDGRATQYTVYSPAIRERFPLIVFSHGAFAAPERYDEMLREVASAGFVVIAPLHIDSELLTLGADAPPQALTWTTRKADVALVIEQPEAFASASTQATMQAPQDGYLLAGHSYGALVVQTRVGAVRLGDEIMTDENALGVIAFSPPGPVPGFIEENAWQSMSVPQLLVTGTADVLPGFLDDWRLHTLAHYQATAGDQWLWVGDGVDHYFGRLIGRLDRDAPPKTEAFGDALATTKAFAKRYSSAASSRCYGPLMPKETALATLSRR